MNQSHETFDQIYTFTLDRLAHFGSKYQHIRKKSKDAVEEIPDDIDFVYIDADHSYSGVWEDLCLWFPKVRIGGIIGGHDYGHTNFPGVELAIDEFFRRFNWEIHLEGEGVWWVEKQKNNVSFIIPAYNCEKTILESIYSILDTNFFDGDEIVIVNDKSSDKTENLIKDACARNSNIKLINHSRNKGGAAARNTALENCRNDIIFCLDSDNILERDSIRKLKDYFERNGADVASFSEIHYFNQTIEIITHKWKYKEGIITLSECLSTHKVPGSSGNYMFTRDSWVRAGGYPEFSGALDAWGFGFRQIATGSKMYTMPDSYYYHRYGHDSYWVRESKKGLFSLIAIQIIIPFISLINDEDVDYIMSRRGRYSWLENIEKRPIRIKQNVNKLQLSYISQPWANVKNKKKIRELMNSIRLKILKIIAS